MGNLITVAEQFKPEGVIVDVREIGSGNINSTFLATLEGAQEEHFILQRINRQVFRRPELVMQNIRVSTEHVSERLKHVPLGEGRRFEIPRVLLARDGSDHWVDAEGSFWRALSFIENARSFDTIQDIDHAREVGRALGLFHTLLSDLPVDSLSDTLEGFHITPGYLRHYESVLAKHSPAKSPDVNYCLQFVNNRSEWAHVLENAKAEGKLFVRPIHGDPKVNNFLIDKATGQAVSIVDLDTIKPGLVHYDIGDCLRSGCNPIGEDVERLEEVRFETDLCRAILQSYLPMAKEFLTENDFEYIYDSVRLIAFELGLRFFTDYLEGNVYFKVRSPKHNLERALVQFNLTESIEAQADVIQTIIKDAR